MYWQKSIISYNKFGKNKVEKHMKKKGRYNMKEKSKKMLLMVTIISILFSTLATIFSGIEYLKNGKELLK